MSSDFYFAKQEGRSLPAAPSSPLHLAPPRRTRFIYDLVAPLYPISTRLFHTRAHAKTLGLLNFEDGSSVLEVAMGSGEMFQKLVAANRTGRTVGIDFSANMAAHSQARIRRRFRGANAHCPCTDARALPFADGAFDVLVCCYLFELLSEEHASEAIDEFCRVLKPGGRLGLILVGQNESAFNWLYKLGSSIAPAFWGRQVSSTIPELLRAREFAIEGSAFVRQLHFRSRVVIARRESGLEACSVEIR